MSWEPHQQGLHTVQTTPGKLQVTGLCAMWMLPNPSTTALCACVATPQRCTSSPCHYCSMWTWFPTLATMYSLAGTPYHCPMWAQISPAIQSLFPFPIRGPDSLSDPCTVLHCSSAWAKDRTGQDSWRREKEPGVSNCKSSQSDRKSSD